MTQIVLDAQLARILLELNQTVEVCDPSGRVIGRFVPLPDVSEEPPGQEERPAEQPMTTELLAHLRDLEDE